MSFGWSAGDIVAAVSLAYDLYKAFDDYTGVSGEYRETVIFLNSLIRTLEPLKTLTDWDEHPTYAMEIREQVALLRTPINDFIQDVRRFEPNLGSKAKKGRYRNVVRKVQWYFDMSKKVSSLKSRIEMHMRVLDTLLQRLTLEILLVTQQSLPDDLRTVIENTIRNEVVTTTDSSVHSQDLSLELYETILHQIQEIKTAIDAQARENSCIVGCERPLAIGCQHLSSFPKSCRDETDNQLGLVDYDTSVTEYGNPGELIVPGEETMQEVYYLVFLYLGHFLRNLFLRLSQAVQPSRQLVPILLAKDNISFLDAMGSPARVLPYEYFRSFKVFQAFILQEFKGVAMIEKQQFGLFDVVGCRWLPYEDSWHNNVGPGSIIAMCVEDPRRKVEVSDDAGSLMKSCPNPTCLNRDRFLERRRKYFFVCSECGMETINRICIVGSVESTTWIIVVPDILFWPTLNSPSGADGVDLDHIEQDLSMFRRITRVVNPKPSYMAIGLNKADAAYASKVVAISRRLFCGGWLESPGREQMWADILEAYPSLSQLHRQIPDHPPWYIGV